MLDEINETTIVPFGYIWEPNPLNPHEPTLVFVQPQADLVWCLEFEQACFFVARLSQEMAEKIQAHPRGRNTRIAELIHEETERAFHREVERRLANQTKSYAGPGGWLRRMFGL